jgi:hypothetical protein
MTKIVRASFKLPTLRAGPNFQNSKQALVFEYWNLGFTWNLVLGICYFAMLHYSTAPLLRLFFGDHGIYRYSRNF